jgi:two-component system, sensor histidine kinase
VINTGKNIASTEAPPEHQENGSPLEVVDVLLVDDRPDGLITLEAVLKNPQYRLVMASSGREALMRVREHSYAVILLDVQMPGMDGFETARRIRQIDTASAIPIIFVTAINKDIGHVYEGYESGAVDYIFKPFDPRVLASKVAVFADLFRKQKKIERQTEALRDFERARYVEHLSRMEIETAKRYQAVLDAIPHIVCVITSTGVAEIFNRTWYDYTGLSESSSAGHGWRTPFPPEELALILDNMSMSQISTETSPDFELECRLLTKQGELRWHLLRAEVHTAGDGAKGWLLTATDIHDLKGAELENARLLDRERGVVRALEEKKVALERSNHDLEQFAYVASHDLQEPLRKVTTFMDLLVRRYASMLPEEAQKFVGFAVDGATRMHDLIEGLLAYSRVDRGIEKQEIEADKILEEVVTDLAHQIRDSKAKVTWKNLPRVRADVTQLRQVFQNLIGNALKFCDSKAPEIEILASNTHSEWVFSVRDNGIGIEPEYADRIFLIFQRLHPQGRYPGSGIGLSICKKIIERHDGRIWFESKPGEGTTFHFSLSKS